MVLFVQLELGTRTSFVVKMNYILLTDEYNRILLNWSILYIERLLFTLFPIFSLLVFVVSVGVVHIPGQTSGQHLFKEIQYFAHSYLRDINMKIAMKNKVRPQNKKNSYACKVTITYLVR